MPAILFHHTLCMIRRGQLCAVCTILLALQSVFLAESQFIPPELSADIPSRLVFRPQGLVEAWDDPDARRAVLRGKIQLDQSTWRNVFADTGGVAVVGPAAQGLDNFTITGESDLCSAQDCISAADSSQFSDDKVPPELNFNFMANAMLIKEGGFLRFDNVIISDIAGVEAYQYSPAQPYRSVGIGSGTWPTLAMAPGSRLVLVNITLVYRNPSPDDTCEQYNQRAIYSLQQVYGTNNVTIFNRTAAKFPNGVVVPVKVFNGSDNTPLGEARIYVKNATFSCVPPPDPAPSGSLSPGALAAAIAVPVAAALLLALAAFCCFRRIRRRRAAARSGADVKDVETGRMSVELRRDVKRISRDQGPSDDSRDKVLPLGAFTGGSAQTSSQRSSGQYQTASYTTGSYPGSSASAATSSASTAPATPGVGVTSPAAAAANLQSPPTTDSDNGRGPALSPAALAAMQLGGGASFNSAKAAAAAAAARQPGVEQYPATDPSAHGQVVFENPSVGQCGAMLQPMHSTEAADSAGLAGATSIATTWPRSSEEPNAEASSSGPHTSSVDASGGRASAGGSGGNSGGRVGAPTTISSGSPTVAGGSSSVSGRTMALYDRASNVSGLLKARSDMAVLRDLKIGPLLGRGSYGRVYKGRWKAVTVAVKIIEHHEGSPGTASSGGKKINVGRESLLATSMAHPNVVQTYHISTMTVSQRNALANSWLEEQEREGGSTGGGKARRNSRSKAGTALGETEDYNDSSSDDVQKDPVETWMLMEFCEKGSLERAIGRGKFVRKDNGRPEMIGIYKALLDTASGLDYLHSIGVVHGDLKTANVLLKGSTRDVRGFACKITDFGLSRVLDLDATHVSTRTYGTIVYMPAELLLTGRMTHATDIYSFGLMMWELYTSTRVFEEGLSIGQIFYMIAYQSWRPPIPPGCPPGFAALMSACWHQNPEQRPTVQQLLRSLQSLYMAEKKAMAAAKDLAARDAANTAATRTATGGTTSDRNSMESDRSDRYRNAAAASREDGTPATAGRPGTAESAAFRSMAAAMPLSAAAAASGNAQQWPYLQQQQRPEQLINSVPSKEALVAAAVSGGIGAPAASSVGEGQGSGGSLATIDYMQFNDSGGADKAGHGSGDTVVTMDENVYQPWAEAVTQDEQAPGSPGAPNRQPSWDGGATQQQQQQQAPGRYHSLRMQDAEIQPAVDNEATPSGSLFQHNTTSSSNAVFEEVQDLDKDNPAALVDAAAAVNYGRRSVDQQLHLRQQQSRAAAGPQKKVADAAQGFVEAIEMVSRPPVLATPSSAAAGPPMPSFPAPVPSSSTSSRQLPYHYQQRPMLFQVGQNPAALQAGLPGNLPVMPSGLASGWSSVSTGTLPPTVGDSPTGSYTTSLPGSFTGPGSATGPTSSARWGRSSSGGRAKDGSFNTSATAAGSRGALQSGDSVGPTSPQAGLMGAVPGSSPPSGRVQPREPPSNKPRSWFAGQTGEQQPAGGVRAPGAEVTSPTGQAMTSAHSRAGGSSRVSQGSPFARAAADDAPSRVVAATAGGGRASVDGADKGPDDDAGPPAAPSPFAALAHRGESLFAPL